MHKFPTKSETLVMVVERANSSQSARGQSFAVCVCVPLLWPCRHTTNASSSFSFFSLSRLECAKSQNSHTNTKESIILQSYVIVARARAIKRACLLANCPKLLLELWCAVANQKVMMTHTHTHTQAGPLQAQQSSKYNSGAVLSFHTCRVEL